jgi:pilus assembly protein CpaC
VELPSGGSIASAGLISTQTQQAVNGFPALMNVPILGALFRSRDYLRNETELMIIVTPYIVHAIDPNQIVVARHGLKRF